ncbi:hypothetical protein L2E82_39801 [Cichorium intybus]|uniref:Uncharacterized protein n=1 Tax=Cichorium intybus TaxID=13427 RepID=A0ACB9AKY6_CICIN|nr:hypothetical protein L2E82_39801 [Cichorium intybus]
MVLLTATIQNQKDGAVDGGDSILPSISSSAATAPKVEAVAYDNPIPGYGTRNTINLRLWPAKPSEGHDIESYNTGDYINAIVNRQKEIIISNVLYPDERSYQGMELRLKQKYFFVSASLQIIYDINFAFIEELKKKIGQDYVRMSRMSIVEEGAVKHHCYVYLCLTATFGYYCYYDPPQIVMLNLKTLFLIGRMRCHLKR